MMRYKRRKMWNEIFNIIQRGETKMGIEDHIRDIIREKVNERVGQEMGVYKRTLLSLMRKEMSEMVRYEVSAHEHRHHRHDEFKCVGADEDLVEAEEFNPDRFNRHDPFRRANAPWCDDEDCELDRQIRQEIGNIAKRHRRTAGAIISRLRKNAVDSGVRPLV